MVARQSQSDSRGDGTPRRGLASDDLLRVVYDELRGLAGARLARLAPGQTLEATALVHEAYLRLVRNDDAGWNSRAHFFGAAARAMRDIMVDNARRKARGKHGGDLRRISMSNVDAEDREHEIDLVGLDAALQELERIDRVKCDVIHLRYFAGLTIDQTADVLGLSSSTIDLHWKYARAWLKRETVRRSE